MKNTLHINKMKRAKPCFICFFVCSLGALRTTAQVNGTPIMLPVCNIIGYKVHDTSVTQFNETITKEDYKHQVFKDIVDYAYRPYNDAELMVELASLNLQKPHMSGICGCRKAFIP